MRLKLFYPLFAVFSLLALIPSVAGADWFLPRGGEERALSFYNTHTREKLTDIVYWRAGRYQADAMAKISYHLRDHRREEARDMAPDLLDLLWSIKTELRARYPQKEIVFHVISGYRSPKTNAMLRAAGGGQARKSRHMHGDAIDIRVPNFKLSEVRDIAWCRQKGGVGYYRGSDFIHIDTDRVRFWHWNPQGVDCGGPNS